MGLWGVHIRTRQSGRVTVWTGCQIGQITDSYCNNALAALAQCFSTLGNMHMLNGQLAMM